MTRKNRRDPDDPRHTIVYIVPLAHTRAERRAAGMRVGVPQNIAAMRAAAGRAPRYLRREFDRKFRVFPS